MRSAWRASDEVGERRPLDELQDERVRLTAVLETINRRDVGMVERGQHLRLALEACDTIGIERERVGDDLQRDVTTEFCIARAIDLAHAARAEGGDDLVRAEARAWGESQTVVDYTGGAAASAGLHLGDDLSTIPKVEVHVTTIGAPEILQGSQQASGSAHL